MTGGKCGKLFWSPISQLRPGIWKLRPAIWMLGCRPKKSCPNFPAVGFKHPQLGEMGGQKKLSTFPRSQRSRDSQIPDPGIPTFQIPDPGIPRSRDSQIPDPGIPGFPDSRSQDSQIPGFPDSQIPGFSDPGIHFFCGSHHDARFPPRFLEFRFPKP